MRPRLAALALIAAAAAPRLPLLERQGLWPDEVFSLAIATGHSLEHPAEAAVSALGDFVEGEGPQPAAAYRRFLAHEEPPAGMAGVARAARLSDTSPPLYYLLLNAWTRLFGTSDASLRGLSGLLSLACLPLLWLVAARIGGRSAAWLACLLFALAPFSVYYGTEGRMYSQLWLLVIAAAWLTLELERRGTDVPRLAAWVGVSAAGLLTHYFFAFAWGGMIAWLLTRGGRARRAALLGMAVTALVVLPWYVHVPQDLGRWRVTRDWLKLEPSGFDARLAPFTLARAYVSGHGPWGGGTRADRAALIVYALAAAALARRWRGRTLQGRRALPWLWLAAACLGPVLLDRAMGTYTGAVPRYAVPGMPAAYVLIGLGLARLRPVLRWLALAFVLASWLPGLSTLINNRSRSFSPLREVARELAWRASERDVVLVHSIPSGVVGVARYMDGPAPIAAWVGQLGRRRVPESVDALSAGRSRVFLVLVHTVGEPAPQESYLRENADVLHDEWRQTARIVEFSPRAPGVASTAYRPARR